MKYPSEGKQVERLENRRILCVHRPKTSNVSSDVYFWGKGSSVCAVTWSIVCSWRQVNQKVTVRKKGCVSIPKNKLWSKSHLCTKQTDLHHITEDLKSKMCGLELNVSLKLDHLDNLCLMRTVLNPRCLSATVKSTTASKLQISADESSMFIKYFVSV